MSMKRHYLRVTRWFLFAVFVALATTSSRAFDVAFDGGHNDTTQQDPPRDDPGPTGPDEDCSGGGPGDDSRDDDSGDDPKDEDKNPCKKDKDPDPPPPPNNPPPDNSDDPSCMGSPVYLQTGGLRKTFTDAVIPGIGPQINLVRVYNSQEEYNGPFGRRWVSEHFMQLIQVSDGINDYAIIRLPNGRRGRFVKNQDGSWTGERVLLNANLVSNPDGTFLLEATCASCGSAVFPETLFNAAGFPVYMADINGNMMTFEYDANDLLTSVTNSAGLAIQYFYNANDKVSSVVLPDGSQFTYEYDAKDNLTRSTNNLGHTTQYEYDAEGRLVAVIDPEDRVALEVSYDSKGRVASYRQNRDTYTYTYATNGTFTDARDSDGDNTRYFYNQAGIITRIQYADGAVRDYVLDGQNKVSSVTSETGKTWTYTYDDSGNVITRTDPLGNVWTYTYDLRFNKVDSYTDPRDNLTTYEFDSNGNKTKKTDALGGEWVYGYDANGLLTTITDPLGNTSTSVYDANGNIISATNAAGDQTTYTYDVFGNVLTEVDANGNTTTYTYYDPPGSLIGDITDPLGNVTSFEYDASGNQIGITDRVGSTTTFVYDEQNRIIQATDALGNTTLFERNGDGKVTKKTDRNGEIWEYTYDSRGRQLTQTDPLGNTTSMTYDRSGNLKTIVDANGGTITNTYDLANQLITIKDALDSTKALEYDGAGNLVKVTDEEGFISTYAYDALNRRITETDPLGGVTQVEYDALGRVTKITDPAGSITTKTYNHRGQELTTTNALGQTTTFEYDAVGNRLKDILPLGATALYTYDALNRMVSAGDTQGVLIQREYDAEGRVLKKIDITGAKANHETLYEYDALGNLLKTTFPGGGSQTILRDPENRSIKMTMEDGVEIVFNRDAAGRITSSVDSIGTTSVTYDAVGNKLTITDPKGNTTTQTFDAMNQQLSTQHPDGSIHSKTYDKRGLLISETKPDSSVIAYEYDGRGNRTLTRLPGDIEETFVYDEAGRMVSATNALGTVTVAYDGLNRVVTDTQIPGTVVYGFDMSVRSRSMTYPNGEVVTRSFDLRDRLASVDFDATNIATYQYNEAHSAISKTTFGNGMVADFSYDPNGGLSALNYTHNSASIFARNITRDARRLITDEDDPNDSTKSRKYTYDAIGRLTKAEVGKPTVAKTYDYTLDAMSNWSSMSEDASPITGTANNLNQYTSFDGAAPTYDSNGNVTDDGQNTYTFDALDRLVGVSDKASGTPLVAYTYDALGRRVSKITASEETFYVYDQGQRVIEEIVEGATQAQYIYGMNANQTLAMKRGATYYYYVADARGSTMQLRSAAGALAEQYEYDPYGVTRFFAPDGSPLVDTAIGNAILFTGQWWESEIGLYNYRARFYNPEWGRFLSRDPLGFRDSMNLYEYVVSNPINRIDPTGMECTEIATVSYDVGQKVKALFNKTVVLRGLNFGISGDVKLKTDQCKTKCCDKNTGEEKQLSWKQFTLSGNVTFSYSKAIPGYSIPAPDYLKAGLMAYIQVTVSASGTWGQQPTADCKLTFFGSGCMSLSGSVGLRFGLDLGEQGSTLGIKAYLEGGIDPSGKICINNDGLTGNFCLGGHVSFVAEVRLWWVSVGTTVDILSGKWCVGNENA